MNATIRPYVVTIAVILRATSFLLLHGLTRAGRPAALARDGRLAPR